MANFGETFGGRKSAGGFNKANKKNLNDSFDADSRASDYDRSHNHDMQAVIGGNHKPSGHAANKKQMHQQKQQIPVT